MTTTITTTTRFRAASEARPPTKLCTCPTNANSIADGGHDEKSTSTDNDTARAIAEATSNLFVRKGKKKPHGIMSFQQLNTEISRRWKLVKPEDWSGTRTWPRRTFPGTRRR